MPSVRITWGDMDRQIGRQADGMVTVVQSTPQRRVDNAAALAVV